MKRIVLTPLLIGMLIVVCGAQPVETEHGSQLLLYTDKDTYILEENVTIIVENIGDETVNWAGRCPVPWDIYTYPDEEYVFETIPCYCLFELAPGENITYVWNQSDQFTVSPVELGMHVVRDNQGWGLSTYFNIVTEPLPNLYLDPPNTVGPPPEIGETLTLTLRLDMIHDLVSFAVDIEWDPTILEYVSWTEGDCLKSNDAGKPTICMFASIVPGKITDLSCVILGFDPGDGVDIPPKPDDLASFEFKVLNYTCEAGTWINITKSQLYNSFADEIPHTVTNAQFTLRLPDLVVADVQLPYPDPILYEGIEYNITVTVSNVGPTSAGSFNVSLELYWVEGSVVDYYHKETVVGLAAGDFVIVHFEVKTSYVGVYLLRVIADCDDNVAESDETNNDWELSMQSRIAGDISGDDKVDHWDLLLLARSYGSKMGEAKYEPLADFNADGKNDHEDLIILGSNYGKTDP